MSSCCTTPQEEESKREYWDKNYEGSTPKNWIEKEEPFVLSWIKNKVWDKNARVFCAGVGDANIVDHLLEFGFTDIIANDISEKALGRLADRVGNREEVTYLVDDLQSPEKLPELFGSVDLYIDRATLHFFTKCEEKQHYFDQVRSLLKADGELMIGVFNKENRPKCCGLDLQLWSSEGLRGRLEDYLIHNERVISFEETNGNIRNYLYMHAQKKR